MQPAMVWFAVPLVIAAVTTYVATRWMIVAAERLSIVDRPGGYKRHESATPLLGGLAVSIGTLLGTMALLPFASRRSLPGISALGIGSLMILAAGLMDDMRGLRPQFKFLWQLSAAATAGLTLAYLGIRLALFLPFPPTPIIILTALWVVGITNSLNFLDNMNGLCAGLGSIAALSLAVANLYSGEPGVAAVAAALAGACAGFLPHNYPRARIFLGDTGSMFIGFLLAALSVMGVYTREAQVPVIAVFTPLFVLGIPVLDLVLVTLIRIRDHHPIWIGDRRHISHRLVQRGMTPAAAVATLWAAGAACGLAALLLPTVGPGQAPLLLGVLGCALGALAAAAGTRGQS